MLGSSLNGGNEVGNPGDHSEVGNGRLDCWRLTARGEWLSDPGALNGRSQSTDWLSVNDASMTAVDPINTWAEECRVQVGHLSSSNGWIRLSGSLIGEN